MKSILILAYHFPPAMNGAVGRFRAYYEHLNKFGLNPVIITVNNLGSEPSGENIYRFNSLYPLTPKPDNKYFYFKRIKEYYNIFDGTLDFRWEKAVKNNINKILEKYDVSAVYSSFPNSVSLKLGIYIKQKYSIPLISEFRDGYAFQSIILNKNKKCKDFIKNFESAVVKNSDIILTVSDVLTEYFKIFYNKYETFTLLNGYENSDFEGLDINPVNNSGKIKVANFGSICISKKRDVSPLYNAIKRLKEEQKIHEKNFELSLIGRYSAEERNLIKESNLSDIVTFYNHIPKREGLQKILNEYDYLLLYGLPEESYVIPSKTFEYIKLGKPVIGICKGNEAEKIILAAGSGEICGFNTDEIARLFEKAINKDFYFNPDKNIINQYSRENQVKLFAEIINKSGILGI